jgi:hypothetical protein
MADISGLAALWMLALITLYCEPDIILYTGNQAFETLKAAILAAIFVFILMHCGFRKSFGACITVMFYISMLFTLRQYLLTDFTQYALDVDGHTAYIASVFFSHRLPEPTGWQSQQPPLYYLIGALFYGAGQFIHLEDPFSAVRFFSLMLYIAFLVLSLFTLKKYFVHGPWLMLAAAIVLFWPEGFNYGGHISNDNGIVFLHAVVLYYLICWQQSLHPRYIRYAIYACCIALTVKGAAIIAMSATALVCLMALYKKQVSPRDLLRWDIVSLCLAAITINFGRTLYYRLFKDMEVAWFLNLKIDKIQGVLTGNTLYNYIYFDVLDFVRYPFYGDTLNGGDLFWNAFLRSLLLNEWTWRSSILASFLCVFFVFMLCHIIYYIAVRIRSYNIAEYTPPLAMMVCMIGALICARIAVPWSAQCNGRYIYGVIVIFALFFGKAIESFFCQGKNIIVAIGIATVILFSVTSLCLLYVEQTYLPK